MKNRTIKLTALLLAFSLTASVFTGCGKKEDAPSTQQNMQSGDENPALDNMDSGEDYLFKPSETGLFTQEKYEYPYAGMNAVLTKTLRDKMDSHDVFLTSSEDYNNDSSLKYAALYWYTLTEEQKKEETAAFDPVTWRAGLGKLGVLGVYHKDSLNELDTLTGCTQHKELGKSADGTYVYYLSTADDADEALKKELEKTEVTLTPMQEIDFSMAKTAFSEARVDADSVGDFKTTDINGKSYTKDMFKNYDLTLVNVFTTWCSPCIEEMPELEKFKKEMEKMGIGTAGVVYDTVAGNGRTDQGAVDTAKQLQKKAKLTFPLLMPDETEMNGRLQGIDSYPESFFVDKNGNIVGEKYMGTHSFEEWKAIAEKELAKLKG